MSRFSDATIVGRAGLTLAVVCAISAAPAAGQQLDGATSNSYTLAEEAALGREAAALIQTRVPLIADARIDAYLNERLLRLVKALPSGLQHAAFHYRVVTLNEAQLVSIAVPGGPLFISRGMIELSPDDAALTGLLAHELSHLALRHATAQATGGERYQLGEIRGRVIGATAVEQAVDIMDRTTQFAVNSYFLAYDAKHERQAERLAAEIMERAGYDARAAGAMFEVALTDGAALAGGWWAMRHGAARDEGPEVRDPGPGMRDPKITARIPDPGSRIPDPGSPSALTAIQARLRAVAPPQPPDGHTPRPIGTVGYSVLPPSGESRTVTAGDGLLLSVPVNWDRMPTGNSVIFAPAGAYLRVADGAATVTHGLQVGTARSLTGTSHGDIHMLLATIGRNNRSITWTPAFRNVRIGGRAGLTTTVSHVSPVTGEFETVSVYAVDLPNGSLLYAVGLAPQYDASVYSNAFTRVLDSIQIID